ncbi:MAG: hypothetical protein JWM74_3127 [Myxococcaceae bacterium]|nr:hypothetical protein [Myxococcaceae bacterium]
MNLHRRHALFLGLALVVLGACSASNTTTSSTTPQEQAQITSPSSGLVVTATIAAVTLGDDCGGGSSGVAKAPSMQDCAAPADAGPDGAASKSECGGGSYCQQSNVQIAFTTSKGDKAAKVTIVEVTLHDATNGSKVDTLATSAPQVWTGSAYAKWDESLQPASDIKASYNLAAPGWSRLSSGTNSYAQKYRLHVTLEIDGVQVILESAVLNREPQVAT